MSKLAPEDLETISSLGGTALRVFLYAVRKQAPIGVRETQRALGLKAPSHAQYHLQRLTQLDLLQQVPGTKYVVREKYRVLRTFKISVLTEVYLLRGWVIPAIGLLTGFASGVLILSVILYFFVAPIVSLAFTSLSLLVLVIWSINQAFLVKQSLDTESE